MTVLSPDADSWSSQIRTSVQNTVRAGDLDFLMAEYAAAARGETRCVVVEGPSGGGAGELLATFVRKVRAAGAQVRRHSCRAVEADLGYEALQRLTGQTVEGPLIPQRLSQSYFRIFSDHLRQGPVVVVLEQAHWCDEASLRWLELLLRRCRGLPLLLVMSQRPALLPQWHRLLDAAGPSVQRRSLVLDAVEDNDVYEWLVRSWTPAVDVLFAHECRRLSVGLPGLLHRLLTRLQEVACPPGPAGMETLAEVGAQLLADHTESVLRGHPPHVRRLAEALAVLGQPDTEVLALLAPVPAALIPGSLELLQHEGLLESRARMPEQVREAVLEGMGASARTARHERAARLLNDTGAAAEQVGEVLLRLPTVAEPWMKEILRQVADQAERAGDVTGAVRCRARLVETGERDVEDLVAYARVLAHLEPGRAHRLVQEALRTGPGVRVRAALAVQLGKSAILLGTVAEAMAELRSVLNDLAGAPGSGAERIQVESALLILACHEAPVRPGSSAHRRNTSQQQTIEDGVASPFDRGSQFPRPAPTVSDLAVALGRARECGWMMPEAGPGGPQQLPWWTAAAPALLRCERRQARVVAEPTVLQQERPWIRLAAQLATQTRVLPRSRRGGVLTPSEEQVARLAAAGTSNREIAATLVISLRTVEMHLTSVYRKLGITGRAGLAGPGPRPARDDRARLGA
ncbi:helix-turn-helix transcriptional regulator [Kineosporia rhizophila]|uniref:helix-turn-helix transcriptional regulator n=1 Tax=Kineosporia rhizophila TaxID=84633 RepID=UPI002FCDB517